MEGTRVGLLLYRTEQDAFSAASHKKAAAATQAGRFKDEIVPIYTYIMDPKTKEKKAITVAADDGIRASTTSEGLSKLKPSFKEGGSTTAGNSSQVLYSYAGWFSWFACVHACLCVCRVWTCGKDLYKVAPAFRVCVCVSQSPISENRTLQGPVYLNVDTFSTFARP
jgi:hypothetical protein